MTSLTTSTKENQAIGDKVEGMRSPGPGKQLLSLGITQDSAATQRIQLVNLMIDSQSESEQDSDLNLLQVIAKLKIESIGNNNKMEKSLNTEDEAENWGVIFYSSQVRTSSALYFMDCLNSITTQFFNHSNYGVWLEGIIFAPFVDLELVGIVIRSSGEGKRKTKEMTHLPLMMITIPYYYYSRVL
nr:hypothetical protein Iba_chr01cCG11190 [Ipomoea batatas]